MLAADSSSIATAQDPSVLAPDRYPDRYSDHFVQFFDADSQLVDAVSRFVQVGIDLDEVCVVVATPDHREQLAASLAARGLSVAALESSYRYIAIDAGSLLAQFFCNGVLDRSRFHDRVGLLMRQVTSSGKPVRIFGEMVALVADEHRASVVLELEELWNELGRFDDFVLFCGYPRNLFVGEHAKDEVNRLCALHTHAVMAWPN